MLLQFKGDCLLLCIALGCVCVCIFYAVRLVLDVGQTYNSEQIT